MCWGCVGGVGGDGGGGGDRGRGRGRGSKGFWGKEEW